MKTIIAILKTILLWFTAILVILFAGFFESIGSIYGPNIAILCGLFTALVVVIAYKLLTEKDVNKYSGYNFIVKKFNLKD